MIIDKIKRLLKNHNVKPTANRIAVMEFIYNNQKPVSALFILDELMRSIPIDKTTVYRTLHTLKENGLVLEFTNQHGVRFYESGRGNHPHLLCRSCDELYCIDLPAPADFNLNTLDTGHRLESFQITFEGLCKHCSNGTVS